MRVIALLLALSSAQAVWGCKATGGSAQLAGAENSAASASAFRTNAEAAAKSLLQKYNNYDLQTETKPNDDCRPLIIDADPSVPFKGTAILFHGYTNCPQQFNELGAILAKKGIQTFAPLSPGHGRAPVPLDMSLKKIGDVSKNDYYGEFLPKIGNDGWKTYQTYVADVNTFAKSLDGPKVVSGLSLGGGMATYAYIEAPGLYDRALLTSPFYGPAGTYAGRNKAQPAGSDVAKRFVGDTVYQIEAIVLEYLSKDMKVVGGIPMGWGESCYKNDAGGRRGICDFRIDNLAAVVANGGDVLKRLKSVDGAKLPKVQYIMTEWDKAADSRLMRQAAALQQAASSNDQVRICAYPHSVPHSFFSRTDILAISDPFWLNSFLQLATDYLAFGQEIPLDAGAPSEEVAFDIKANGDSSNFLKRCSIYSLPYDQVFTKH